MTDPRSQIDDILVEASELEPGPTKIALVEEAVRLADAANDDEYGSVTRHELISATTYGGRPDLGLVAFAWLLAKADADPDAVEDPDDLLWKYKWVIEDLADFPHISRQQIDAMFVDMARRYTAAGASLHAVHNIRRDVAMAMFDRPKAEECHAKMLAARWDHLSNCKACVQDGLVDYEQFLGDDKASVKAAQKILSGKMTCGEVPDRTYPTLVLPYLRLGQPEKAADCYKKGYRMIRTNPKFVAQKGLYAAFLALTGNRARAVTLLERHLPEVVASTSPAVQLDALNAFRLVLEVVAGRLRTDVKVPTEIAKSKMLPAVDLCAWMDAKAGEIATAFDARNENTGATESLTWYQRQLEFATDFPISTTGRA